MVLAIFYIAVSALLPVLRAAKLPQLEADLPRTLILDYGASAGLHPITETR